MIDELSRVALATDLEVEGGRLSAGSTDTVVGIHRQGGRPTRSNSPSRSSSSPPSRPTPSGDEQAAERRQSRRRPRKIAYYLLVAEYSDNGRKAKFFTAGEFRQHNTEDFCRALRGHPMVNGVLTVSRSEFGEKYAV